MRVSVELKSEIRGHSKLDWIVTALRLERPTNRGLHFRNDK